MLSKSSVCKLSGKLSYKYIDVPETKRLVNGIQLLKWQCKNSREIRNGKKLSFISSLINVLI